MLRINCGFLGANTASLQLIHYGAEVTIDIGFDEKWRTTSTTRPTPDVSSLKALVDTGARESCLDLALAERLNFPQVDRRWVRSAAGMVEVNYFRAQIYVPNLKLALTGPFAALPLIESGFKFEAILGRSFLRYVRLEYDGPTGDCNILRSP